MKTVANQKLSKKVITVFSLFLAIISFLFIYVSVKNNFHLSCNDTFFYLSVADNMVQNKVMLSGTTTPPGPIVTPQNGITFIFFVLKKFSISNTMCINTMLVINGICLAFSLIPLIKIARSIGLKDTFSLLALLTVYLGNLRIFQWLYFSPINDMVFIFLSMCLIYLLIKMEKGLYADGETNCLRSCFLLSLVVCIIIPHFRINAFFIPLAGCITTVLIKRFRLIKFFLIQLVVMIISLYGIYAVLQVLGYEMHFMKFDKNITGPDFANFFFYLFPRGIFTYLTGSGCFLYLPFYLAILIGGIQGIRQKNFPLLTVTLVTIATMGIALVYTAPLARYIWPTTAFIYMLVLKNNRLRPIGILFVCAVVLGSFMMIYNGVRIPARTNFWQHVARQVPWDSEGTVLISQSHRIPWYFTGVGALKDSNYSWNQLIKAPIVYLGGPEIYVNEQVEKIDKLARQKEYKMTTTNLTSDYVDRERRVFYQLTFIPEDLKTKLP